MAQPSWPAGQPLQARALLVGERLEQRGLTPDGVGRADPLPLAQGAGIATFVFRWGAVAVFGATAEAERTLLAGLGSRIVQPLPAAVEETATLAAGGDDTVDSDGIIRIVDFGAERLAVVADALAKSAALAHQEAALAQTLDGMEPVISSLKRRGRLPWSTRPLIRSIACALDARSRATARIEAEDKPEVLWTRPDLETLHARLVDEFELRERSAMLDRKLVLIGETVESLIALVDARRSSNLELAVSVFVVLEVVTTIYDVLFK